MLRVAALATLVLLTGCAGDDEPAGPKTQVEESTGGGGGFNDDEFRDITVNGTRCIVYDGGHDGGISCDFTKEGSTP